MSAIWYDETGIEALKKEEARYVLLSIIINKLTYNMPDIRLSPSREGHEVNIRDVVGELSLSKILSIEKKYFLETCVTRRKLH